LQGKKSKIELNRGKCWCVAGNQAYKSNEICYSVT